MPTTITTVAQDQGLDPHRVLTGAHRPTLPMWNAEIVPRPAAVVRCDTTAHVRAAVRTARALGLPISVFSGGNDWAGRSARPGSLVVDVSTMTAVEIDPGQRVARIGGGVRSDELARRAEAVGLTPVTGTVGLVGMLGLSLGGGYGPLDGRFGLACDNLVAAELVTATGTVVEIDAASDTDLLWALRGGGGNFGVVVSATVRLHRIGPVHTGMIVYSWREAASVLTRLNPLLLSCEDALSIQTIVGTGPDGHPFVAVMPTWSGPPDQGPAAVAPLLELGDPVSCEVGPSSWHAMIASVSASFPAGRHVRIRTRNVPEFSPPVVERLVEAGSSRASSLSALSIHPFHGAATRVPVTATAFGERRPHQMVEIVAMWAGDDHTGAADAVWADRVHASLAADAMPGGYVNLLAADDDAVPDAYGPNAERLLAVKNRLDPSGLFAATPLPAP